MLTNYDHYHPEIQILLLLRGQAFFLECLTNWADYYLHASFTRTVLNPISMECEAVALTQTSVAIPVT